MDGVRGDDGRPPRAATQSTELARVQVVCSEAARGAVAAPAPGAVCYSGDGRSLCVCVGSTVRMCPVDVMLRGGGGGGEGEATGWIAVEQAHGAGVAVTCCCWSAADDGFVTGDAGGWIQVWRLTAGRGEDGRATPARWRRSGARLGAPELLAEKTVQRVTAMVGVLDGVCVGYATGVLAMFCRGALVRAMPPLGLPQGVSALDATYGGLVVVAGDQGAVQVRDFAKGYGVVAACQRASRVLAVKTSPRGTVLLGHADGTISMCSCAEREMPVLSVVPGHKGLLGDPVTEGGPCRALVVIGGGSTVVSAGHRGLLLTAADKKNTLQPVRAIPGTDKVAVAAAGPGKNAFVSLCARGTLTLYGVAPSTSAAAAAATSAAFPTGARKNLLRDAQGPVQLARYLRA